MKTHVTYSRLNDKHFHQYLGGKAFTIKPSDHENENNHVVELHFNAKKHMNKFHRNLAKGSGTRISPHELNDIKVHTGNGFFDSIRNAFNKVGDVAKTIVNSPVTKGFVRTIAPIATKMAGEALNKGVTAYTGNPALGEVAGNLGQKGLQAGSDAYTGSGISRAKKGKRSNIILGGSFAPLGGSVKGKVGGALIESQQFQGIGSTPGLEAINSNDVHARMKNARAHIGRNRLS